MGLRTDETSRTLMRALDAAALRHKTIATNIANVETPNYRRREVRFEEALQKALDGGGALPEPQVVEDPAPGRADGNNVNIDQEMAELSENALRYEALVQGLAARTDQLQTVITEGRR